MKILGGRLGSRWAGVGRHQRLQGSVIAAFVVAALMATALLLSAGRLVVESRRNVQQSENLLALQSEIVGVNSALDGYDGSQSARQSLAGTTADLGMALDAVDGFSDSGWSDNLRAVIPSVTALDNGSLEGANAIAKGAELAQRLEQLSGQVSIDSQQLAGESSSNWSSWFEWVVGVSIVGLSFLALSVWKAILPLNRSIRRSLSKLESWTVIARRQSERRRLAGQLTDGLDAANSEAQAYTVIERTLREITSDHKVEILLADSSNAHLRSTVAHPDTGSPGCNVASPWSCPAVRRGSTLSFADSTSIRACPHLAKRNEACSAVCSPLIFMGQPIGVVHATGPVGAKPPTELVEDLGAIASEASTRLGTIRAFARAEMQASTDVLTGLSNRRATEERIGRLVAGSRVGALVLVEVGGLVELNSRLGKEGGDHALRIFADTVRESIRADDWCGRWAGAQFVMVLDGMPAMDAQRRVETIQARIMESFGTADMGELAISVGVTDSAGVVDTRTIIAVAESALDAVKAGRSEPVDDTAASTSSESPQAEQPAEA